MLKARSCAHLLSAFARKLRSFFFLAKRLGTRANLLSEGKRSSSEGFRRSPKELCNPFGLEVSLSFPKESGVLLRRYPTGR